MPTTSDHRILIEDAVAKRVFWVVGLALTLMCLFLSLSAARTTIVEIDQAQSARLNGVVARVSDLLKRLETQLSYCLSSADSANGLDEVQISLRQLLRLERTVNSVTHISIEGKVGVSADREALDTVGISKPMPLGKATGLQFGGSHPVGSLGPSVDFQFRDNRGYGGTLNGRLSLNPLSELIAEFSSEPATSVYVTDSLGRLVAHRDVVLAMSRPVLPQSKRGSPGWFEQFLALDSKSWVAKDSRGEWKLMASAEIGSSGWKVYFERSLLPTIQGIFLLLLASLGLLISAMLAAFFVSRLVGRRITRPIVRLRDSVELARIEHVFKVDESVSHDELGDLQSAFQRLYFELESANSTLEVRIVEKTRDLATANHQLEIASKHKSDFLAHMSHELRTPLNAVIGFSEMLKAQYFGPLNEKQAEYVKDINDSGQHLLALINEILDLAKVEAGRMELVRSNAHVPIIVEACCTLVSERFQRKRQVLDAVVEPSVSFWFLDERKFKQCLLNLLSNANKFTPEGGRVGLRVFVEEGSAPLPLGGGGIDTLVAVGSGGEGDGGGSAMLGAPFDRPPLPNPLPPGERGLSASLVVEVTDTGLGIAADALPKLFSEFYQVAATTAAATSQAGGEGTGLGLALTKKFVELHGGTVEVTSVIGEGSVFTLRFPAGAAEATEGTGGVA